VSIAPAPAPADISKAFLCPLCTYDLRGCVEPRCPECGFQFSWEELTDPSRRHPYLFEHHLNHRVRAFFRTLFATLAPSRFWTALHPAQPSNLSRLIAYWMLASLPLVLQLAIAQSYVSHLTLARWGGARASSTTSFVAADAVITIALIAWPWLTAAGLMIFQISMRRARIRAGHVLRCALYSADAGFWIAPLIAALALMDLSSYGNVSGYHLWLMSFWRPAVLWMTLAWLPVLTYRLWQSIRLYLHFRHAVIIVLLVQSMVLIVYVTFFFVSGAWLVLWPDIWGF
jgi:hypothetical protein